MTPKCVIGIGETVLDILFKNDQPQKAVPGGSTFNSIVSLGRAGVPCAMMTEVGGDHVGDIICRFLTDNGVSAEYVCRHEKAKSHITLAFLDEHNDAQYLFYKDHASVRLDGNVPQIGKDDVVLFGSFFAINPVVRPQVHAFLEYARQHGAILYYDVNYRASHRNDLVKVMPNLLENFELADILRGSNEDFDVMYGKKDADSIYRSEISFYTKKFIYTCGAKPVELRADGGLCKQYPVTPTETVSTIGAGDNFNAGFVYGLIHYGVTRSDIDAGLTEQQWDRLIACAQAFSANCCRSLSNCIDHDFAASLKNTF